MSITLLFWLQKEIPLTTKMVAYKQKLLTENMIDDNLKLRYATKLSA